MRRVSERHPSVQSARFIDFHATLNLASALSSLPDAEAYPGFRDLVLDGARRGVGPVRALVSGGVPIELVERAVWHHRGLAHVNVVAEAVPRDLLKLLPLSMCRNRAVIPYHNDGESAVVAVSDPADISVLDEVRRRLGRRRVRLVVADRDNIMRVIQLLEARLASEALELVANSNGSSPVEEQDDASGQVAQLVTNLVVQGCAARASDIHIEPTAEGVRIRFRIDGVLHHIITYPKSLAAGLTNRLKVMADLDVSDRRRPHEGRFAMSTGDSTVDVRLVTFPTVWGEEGAAVRIFGGLMPVIGLDRLGMSPWVLDAYLGLCFSRHGLVLATGPAGSGKTTTLYAALDRLAAADSRVLTVEDPVEIRFPHMTQVQVNTKAGLTFATALRSFLRSDPDILLVGEIRDYETAQLSVEAALTGHLVLASMHAKSAPAAVIRLLEMGIAPNDAASALRGVVSQRLVRRLCRGCRTADPVDSDTFDHLTHLQLLPKRIYRAPVGGCASCGGSGYVGRMPMAEVMSTDDRILEAVGASPALRDLTRLAVEAGMVPMSDDGLVKVMRGETSLAELRRE